MISENADKVRTIVRGLKDREDEIGKRLTRAARRIATRDETIGTCPTCGKGTLFIIRSRNTGKRFIGCTNYFKGICKTSFPLPQSGFISRSGRACKRCGWPTLRAQTKLKHFWTLCFNPQCPGKRIKNPETSDT
jgi:DNA topoisomerase-1